MQLSYGSTGENRKGCAKKGKASSRLVPNQRAPVVPNLVVSQRFLSEVQTLVKTCCEASKTVPPVERRLRLILDQ